jgi:hypothetical protein
MSPRFPHLRFLLGASLLGILGFPAVRAQVAVELVPASDSVAACGGELLEVSVRLSNPGAAEIVGYQVFLRYPSRYLEPVRYEPSVIEVFDEAGFPGSRGAYLPCAAGADDWDDGVGDDVVSVVASAFQEEDATTLTASATVGVFVFRVRGEASDGARFASNDLACHDGVEQTTRVFGRDGRDLLASAPQPVVVRIETAGPSVDSFSCTDRGASVLLTWSASMSGISGYRIYRDGESLALLPIASLMSFEDKSPPPGTVTYEIAVVTGGAEGCRAACALERAKGALFLRGDSNRDSQLNIADAVATLNHLFREVPTTCEDASDVDDDGRLGLTDALDLLNFLFQSGVEPPPPFAAPGRDPTPDDLTCIA